MRLRRETLGAQVYELLRDRILRGELSGGERLVQGPLSEELGISRIPVRDALKRLESDGLVAGDEVGRYAVVPFGPNDAREIYAIRRRLEPLAAEMAAETMTPDALADIQALHRDLAAAVRGKQVERYIELNVQFHMTIYEASGMKRLVRLIGGLWLGVPPLTPMMLEGRMRRSQKEHDEIIRRLAARDPAGAAAALERHIDNAGSELMRSMPGERAVVPPRRQAG